MVLAIAHRLVSLGLVLLLVNGALATRYREAGEFVTTV